jgi:hypothetical protein
MTMTQNFLRSSILLGLIALASACVIAEPREGFYDRDHHRYYAEHSWHDCGERDDRCR